MPSLRSREEYAGTATIPMPVAHSFGEGVTIDVFYITDGRGSTEDNPKVVVFAMYSYVNLVST